MSKNRLWLLIAIVAIGLIGSATLAFAHSGGNVALKDENGTNVAGTTNPYSPKATCARTCHVNEMVNATQAAIDKYNAAPYNGTFPGHNYESHIESVSKKHTQKNAGALGAGTTYTYLVPVPTKGISTSYHVQQGRNVAWGDVQRDFFAHYLTFGFASSNSMYGKA
jgi:hypothetical protein